VCCDYQTVYSTPTYYCIRIRFAAMWLDSERDAGVRNGSSRCFQLLVVQKVNGPPTPSNIEKAVHGARADGAWRGIRAREQHRSSLGHLARETITPPTPCTLPCRHALDASHQRLHMPAATCSDRMRFSYVGPRRTQREAAALMAAIAPPRAPVNRRYNERKEVACVVLTAA